MASDEATARRTALIAQLDREGVLRDDAVRAALLAVPRHAFLPEEPLDRAYANDAIPTKFAGEIAISSASQPAMVAVMLEQLALEPGMQTLEIGAGTGYNAALLRALVGPTGHVTTVDIDADITAAARRHLASVGLTDIEIITGDGAAGYAPNAPYDRIILTVNAGDIAPAWFAQLKSGGVIVLPLSVGPAQFSIAFVKEVSVLRSRSLSPCSFMPLRGTMGDDATGARTATAAPGLRLMMTNAAAPDAARIAAILQTAPDHRAVAGAWQSGFSALAFAVADSAQPCVFAFVSSDDARYGFIGHGYGVFNLTAGGGAIIRLSDAVESATDTTMLVYGDPQTGAWLGSLFADWVAHGASRLVAYRVTAMPADVPLSAPDDGFIVKVPHWNLVFRVEAPLP
ncbi:MAG: methyltransferase domain-containing protein [Thermomicrobia bacterium]|nr:methyltransferase domain-containing protein [Thermomicrobia bacterium]MCA1722702.1 methyltransferase domain-containing protein [Thermomicrobia bacterium]